jgi:hypothetical protein
MTWHVLFEKKYEPNSKENIFDTYDAISSELEKITHNIVSTGELRTKGYVHKEFLVPNKMPLSIVKLYGELYLEEADTEVLKCIGIISFEIQHFKKKKSEFPKLDKIAQKYDLKYTKTKKS